MEKLCEKSIEAAKKNSRARSNHPNKEKSKKLMNPSKSPKNLPVEYEEISSDDSYHPPNRRRRSSSYSSQLSSDYYGSSTYSASRIENRPAYEELMNEEVTFINVCRLMSALEPELGSLNERALDLLSKAVAIEKAKPNTSDQILMTSDNAIFLETVKQKMKGLLMVDALPRNKVVAVKKCIQNIARLIHQTPITKEEKKVKSFKKHQDEDEKMKLALEIAEVLISHGKQDISTEDLEAIMESFLESLNEQAGGNEERLNETKKTNQYTSLNSLSDDDLKILLSNFNELDTDEQDQLIDFLSFIEKTNPSRVDELRKFMIKNDQTLPKPQRNETNVIEIDSDPEDYNIDEVINSYLVSQTDDVNTNFQPGENLTDNLLLLAKNRNFEC